MGRKCEKLDVLPLMIDTSEVVLEELSVMHLRRGKMYLSFNFLALISKGNGKFISFTPFLNFTFVSQQRSLHILYHHFSKFCSESGFYSA